MSDPLFVEVSRPPAGADPVPARIKAAIEALVFCGAAHQAGKARNAAAHAAVAAAEIGFVVDLLTPRPAASTRRRRHVRQ